MSFFLVDDGFSSHEKVSRLIESARPDRGQLRFVALSLWLLAGSECARRRNGGRVSRMLARTLLCTTGRHASQAADLLVEVGLWDRDGDSYVFHDWSERQRPRDRRDAGGAPSASQQPAGSEPAADHRDAGSEPVENTQPASGTQVANHAPSVIPSTSDTTPLSSSSSSSSLQGRETRSPLPPHLDAFERSFRAPTSADAAVAELVSRTRQEAGGGPYVPTGWRDTQAVQRLREWGELPEIGSERLEAALVAFWLVKGPTAPLCWLTDEEPGRFLGAPAQRRRGPLAPKTHEEFERLAATSPTEGRNAF